MAQPPTPHQPTRPRRTHADRTAETRAKIIAAVIDSISDVGFQRTTAAEITERAGVTWGAVQHHFGGKDGTLVAVLENSFNRFAERVSKVDVSQRLEDRVSNFVDQAWKHFDSAHYRSTLEILLHYSGQPSMRPEPWHQAILSAFGDTWRSLFGDVDLPRHQLVTLQRYTVSVLSGLASIRFIGGPDSPAPRAELRLLKQTLNESLRPERTRK